MLKHKVKPTIKAGEFYDLINRSKNQLTSGLYLKIRHTEGRAMFQNGDNQPEFHVESDQFIKAEYRPLPGFQTKLDIVTISGVTDIEVFGLQREKFLDVFYPDEDLSLIYSLVNASQLDIYEDLDVLGWLTSYRPYSKAQIHFRFMTRIDDK